MDPIKVDFSKKDGGRKKDVVIPPEKAALKIVLSLLCSAVFAGILFYFMLPALNFKSYDLYIYLGAIVASYVVFNALFSNVFGKPEYVPYVKRRAIVPGIIIAVLLVAVGIGYLVSCEFFRASSYSKIISVDTDSNFSEDVEEPTASARYPSSMKTPPLSLPQERSAPSRISARSHSSPLPPRIPR